jgi:segregation and condensation protein A
MQEYRVSLDTYNGPLDLLLYLIRRDEIDIYDIPIASITRQYVQYVEMIQQLDPNLAGEFLVLAATLMEIKTRLLLPPVVSEEGGETTSTSDLDPRAELVRQLLEYKAFKDAAGDLAQAAVLRAQKFARRPFLPQADPTELDMEDVQVWDLLEAFGKILDSIGRSPGQHEVIYDDTPVELHAEDILDRLRGEGAMSFARLFEGRTNRGEIVGLFIALLELVRQKKVFAAQDDTFGEIAVQLNPDPPAATTDDEAGADAFIAGDQSRVGEDSGDVIRLTGKEFGDIKGPKELREAAKKYAFVNFAGKTVEIGTSGNRVLISRRSIRETLSGDKTPEEMRAVTVIPQLLQHAVKVGEKPDKKGRPYVTCHETYHSILEIAGEQYTAEIGVIVIDESMRIFEYNRVFYNQKLKEPNRQK